MKEAVCTDCKQQDVGIPQLQNCISSLLSFICFVMWEGGGGNGEYYCNFKEVIIIDNPISRCLTDLVQLLHLKSHI